MKNYKIIIKGILISFLITIVLLLVFSGILAYTDVSENTITPVIIIITAISILFGSSISTIKIKKNGMINGGFIGAIYLLILYVTSSILNWKFGFDLKSIVMIFSGILFGIIGGIIGVNRN